MRLCGIISRFQLLSPSTRQVTHALLTRPPLSHFSHHPEGISKKCFVRLACVKHAASVHPEPGSNSQIKVDLGQKALACLTVTSFDVIYCFIKKRSKSEILIEFSGLFHCSVINVLGRCSQKRLGYLNTI